MDGVACMDGSRANSRLKDVLDRSRLLARVAMGRRQAVLEAVHLGRMELMQGEVLCTEGENATSFWLLTRGQVEVTGQTPDRGVFVEQRGPGDLIGELAAMLPGSPRSATVRALDHQTEAYCFSMRAIEVLPCEDRLGVWQGLASHVAVKLAATVPTRTSALLVSEEREVLLRRFVNGDALGRIRADGPEGYERREAVILFSDLVGFSAMAEKASPEQVAASLRAAMSAQADVVEEHGGFVDKMIGDGLMAYWLPESDALDERRRVANAALDAAVAAAGRVAAVPNPVTGQPLQVRIGFHIGQVHYGNFGSDRRWAITLIGQPVNVASRIESAKPTAGEEDAYGPLRVSAELAELLDERHLAALPHKATVMVKTDLVTFVHRQPE